MTRVAGYPGSYTAHQDTFARDHLPPPEQWPDIQVDGPQDGGARRVNCAGVLIDEAVAEGNADRIAVYCVDGDWTYGRLLARANQIANALVSTYGVVPGNRVLLRAPNSPMLIAAWLAVVKAGAIAVTTMPMLRAKELGRIAEKARITHALCDARLVSEVAAVHTASGWLGEAIQWGDGTLEKAMAAHSESFANVDTASDDTCLIAFTSGTTGDPKATVHFHRDVLAMADVVGGYLLETGRTDIYLGSPPLGFTFGLGALLVFPLRFRGAVVAIERPTPDALLTAVEQYRATCLFTAPTMYRTLAPLTAGRRLSCLRGCVSAGEPLPKSTSDLWFDATGIRLIDGIGATEMTHIFISAKGEAIRPGATGKPLPGYQAVILDDAGERAPAGQVGRLAVRGLTGCRYLADARQQEYVVDGWNVTGDLYLIDDDGYFWFQARKDDMIVSSGYNIAAAEVEGALLGHAAVHEVAVVGIPDPLRGQVVKAYVVPAPGVTVDAGLIAILQDFVKSTVAPYKYPRAIEFVSALPKTATGKVQRAGLRRGSP